MLRPRSTHDEQPLRRGGEQRRSQKDADDHAERSPEQIHQGECGLWGRCAGAAGVQQGRLSGPCTCPAGRCACFAQKRVHMPLRLQGELIGQGAQKKGEHTGARGWRALPALFRGSLAHSRAAKCCMGLTAPALRLPARSVQGVRRGAWPGGACSSRCNAEGLSHMLARGHATDPRLCTNRGARCRWRGTRWLSRSWRGRRRRTGTAFSAKSGC